MVKTPTLCVQVKEEILGWRYGKPVVFTAGQQSHIKDCADCRGREEALNQAIETWRSFATEPQDLVEDMSCDLAHLLLGRVLRACTILREQQSAALVRGELLLIHEALYKIRIQGAERVLKALPRTLLLAAVRGAKNRDKEQALLRHWREEAAQP